MDEERKPTEPEEQPEPPEGTGADQSLWQLLHDAEGDEESSAGSGLKETKPTSKPQAFVNDDSLPDGFKQEDTVPYRGEMEPLPDGYVPDRQREAEPPELEKEDVTDLQKVLADPDKYADTVDFSGDDTQTQDFDTAVLSFYKEDQLQVSCKNHPQREMADKCPECDAYYCQTCLVVRNGRLLCRDCAEALYVPTEEEVLAAAERGEVAQGAGVTPEEKPEFQASGAFLGLEGQPAHPVKRLLALAIDLLLTRVFGLLILLLLNLVGIFEGQGFAQILERSSSGGFQFVAILKAFFLFMPPIPWLIFFAILDFAYYFVTLAFWNRTYGMSWLSCRVISEWGEFVSFGAISLRTLLFMTMLGWPAILFGWFFPAYRGPHDYLAGTLVINYAGVKRVDAYETVQIKL